MQNLVRIAEQRRKRMAEATIASRVISSITKEKQQSPLQSWQEITTSVKKGTDDHYPKCRQRCESCSTSPAKNANQNRNHTHTHTHHVLFLVIQVPLSLSTTCSRSVQPKQFVKLLSFIVMQRRNGKKKNHFCPFGKAVPTRRWRSWYKNRKCKCRS